jgi:enoyl-CoA hydratase
MTVLIEKKDRIFTVIINRPEVKNAVDRPTAEALADAFLEFENDDSFSVAVLCGAGNTFCAGADLKAGASLDETRMNRLETDGDGPMGPSRMMLKKSVIAAVAGYAVAGGLELALWCDMRVMEETAVFGVFCRRFGVPLIDGGTVRLPRLIGMSNAMDLILTGRPVEAIEAQQMGLANRIVPHGKSREAAEELAKQIANFPQTCMRNDRMSVYEQWDKSFKDAMENEFQRGMKAINKGETLHGATMFTKGVGRHGKFE